MKTSVPRVSIVIPVYNAQRFLPECIASVRAQSVLDWELVIVDDGSADDSFRIAARAADGDERIRVVQQANRGVSAARNRGFAEADSRTQYIAFLDADDVWEEDMLAVLLDALERKPQVAGAYGVSRYIDDGGRFVRVGELESYQRARRVVRAKGVESWPLDNPTTFEVEAFRNYVSTVGTVLFRRGSLVASGLFDPDMGHFEDWDLMLRVCLHGPLHFENRLVLRKRSHEGNVSNDMNAMMRGARAVRRSLLLRLRSDARRYRVALLGQSWMHLDNASWQLRQAVNCVKQDVGGAVAHLSRALTSALKCAGLTAWVVGGTECRELLQMRWR